MTVEAEPNPPAWPTAALGEHLYDIEAGKSFSCEERPPRDGEVGVLKVSAVSWGEFQEEESKTCKDPERVNPDYFVEGGDLLISRANTIELVGAVVLVRNVDRQLMLSDKTLRLKTRGIDKKWVLYYLRSMSGRMQIEDLATGNQASMRNISQKNIKRIEIPVPPLDEQRRIVAKIEELFSNLDAGVDDVRAVQKQLERYRLSVLQAAVEGRLTAAWRRRHEVEPAERLLERILEERRTRWEGDYRAKYEAKGKQPPSGWKKRYSAPEAPEAEELTELPDRWTWVRVNQVGEVQLGRQRAPKYHQGEHMRPYLRVANVFEDCIDTSDVKEMHFSPSDFEKYKLEHGDILLNEGQSLELVGRPAMYRGEVPNVCFQNTLIRFRAYAPLNAHFALIVYRAYMHNGTFQNVARQTTSVAHLGATRFADMPFPLPPTQEQRQIVAEVERLLSVADDAAKTVELELQRAERLRQSILKRAFRGRLVLPTDANDDDAADSPEAGDDGGQLALELEMPA